MQLKETYKIYKVDSIPFGRLRVLWNFAILLIFRECIKIEILDFSSLLLQRKGIIDKELFSDMDGFQLEVNTFVCELLSGGFRNRSGLIL